MKSLAEQLSSYAQYHRDPRTKLTHFFGVPMVTLSLFIFLGWFRFIHSSLPISMALVFFLAVAVYYLVLDFQVGALTLLCNLPLLVMAHYMAQARWGYSLLWFLFCFVGGWAIQLWGHYYEGRRPALADNIMQIFNAPLFLICEVLFKFHKREELKSRLPE
jgi:uncharacterized membrane protein YGL010W